VSKSLRNLFVDLSPAVFAFALLIGAGCSPAAKPPTPAAAAAADEPLLPKTVLHAADEPALPKPPPRALAREWYSPREADFRPQYDRDAVNQAKESWSDYWSWVKTFYQGNLFSPGWTAQGTASLNGVGSETARDELRSDLNELGRRCCLRVPESSAPPAHRRPRLRAKRGNPGGGRNGRKRANRQNLPRLWPFSHA